MSHTERTIRESNKWLKISRNSKTRTFTFALGNSGEFNAEEVRIYPFKYIQTWADAEEYAKAKLADYQ